MYESYYSIEILQMIFDHIDNTSEEKEARNTFYQCQLVCRNWSRCAQFRLYKNLYLPPHKIASFAATLEATHVTSRPGDMVKNIEFYVDPSVSIFPQDVDHYLDIILQHCPYIEKFDCPTSIRFETEHLWRRLLAAQNQYRRLKHFPFSEEWSPVCTKLYSSLALMFRDSITKLSLIPDQDDDFLSLKKSLKEFISLKQLQIFGYFVTNSILPDLDDLVNYCHQTTHSLELQNCDLLNTSNYTPGENNPNFSIENLQLINAKLPGSSVRYFAHKMKSLKTLVLANPAQLQTEEENTEWWNQMTLLCLPLRNYNISIDRFDFSEYLQQIRGCVNMSKTLVKHTTQRAGSAMKMDSTELTMCLNYPMVTKGDSIIEMKQNDSRVRLFNSASSYLFKTMAKFDLVFECIQPFLPSIIRILNVQHPLHFDDLLQNHNSGSHLNNVLLKNYNHLASKDDPISDLIPACRTRNWDIFNGVISINNAKTGSAIHLDKMIFPDSEQTDQTEQVEQAEQASISELKFTDSLIHSNAFPAMSSKISKVDTLILDGCTIMSDTRYQLDINLLETNLGHLELKLNNVGSLKCQTIVVTTDKAKTTTYRYTENTDCASQEDIINTAGSANNFLIAIRCKELQSWGVSGTIANDNKSEWKQLVF